MDGLNPKLKPMFKKIKFDAFPLQKEWQASKPFSLNACLTLFSYEKQFTW